MERTTSKKPGTDWRMFIDQIVDQAPPLAPGVKNRLRGLLGGGER